PLKYSMFGRTGGARDRRRGFVKGFPVVEKVVWFAILLYAVVGTAPDVANISRFAIRRRFCAMAASKNSSCAPLGPRSRKRSSLRMRLRWANSISTFLSALRDCRYASVLARARATSRAGSNGLRSILGITMLGQHLGFNGQAWQSYWLAR